MSAGAGDLATAAGGRARRRRLRAALAALVLGALVTWAPAWAQQAARSVNEQTVHEVASQLRCVVCQNLSVGDSPSEMASQMRQLVRERLARGDTPEQVVQYFVDKYGEWILLKPTARGFNLLVWGFPVAAVLAGLGVVAVLLRRWTRARPGGGAGPAAPEVVDPEMAARIRREMEAE